MLSNLWKCKININHPSTFFYINNRITRNTSERRVLDMIRSKNEMDVDRQENRCLVHFNVGGRPVNMR